MHIIVTKNPEVLELAKKKGDLIICINEKDKNYKSEKVNIINNKDDDKEKSLDYTLSKFLMNLGIPPHIKGFNYIKYLLCCYINDTSLEGQSITKVIYPLVAKKFNTTSSKVERAIFHAIEFAFYKGDSDDFKKLFAHSSTSLKGKPTNSEFLSVTTLYVKDILL